MNREVASTLFAQLEIPAELMAEAIEELDFLARYKYDHYEMYVPAGRFFEHLYRWLKQFRTVEDKLAALEFLRNHVVFISQREMQDLARFLYYEQIVPKILDQILQDQGLPPFSYGEAFKSFPQYLRRCLFIGLSDGAKIDYFRRHNQDVSQEQVLPYYRTSSDDYLGTLRDELDDRSATFWAVFLIDDFTGSGYTLLREEANKETGIMELNGSLERVYKQHKSIIDAAKSVVLCEYVATHSALEKVRSIAQRSEHFGSKFDVLCPLILPPEISITPESAERDVSKSKPVGLCETYYSESFETHNTTKGGGIQFGYGGQGLPLVLYSNTPNNSLFLLWFGTAPDSEPPFTPLFMRIDRHKPL
jgi:hypothetical protein